MITVNNKQNRTVPLCNPRHLRNINTVTQIHTADTNARVKHFYTDRWPIGQARVTLRLGRPECLRETLFSIVHRKHKTNAAPSHRIVRKSAGHLQKRNLTNPAKHIIHKSRKSIFRLGPGRKHEVPWLIRPFLHCGLPNTVLRHTGVDQSTQVVNVRNVVRITVCNTSTTITTTHLMSIVLVNVNC